MTFLARPALFDRRHAVRGNVGIRQQFRGRTEPRHHMGIGEAAIALRHRPRQYICATRTDIQSAGDWSRAQC